MAKDRKKLIHIHSSIPDKQPTPQSLEVGEIAVNNHANQEFLSIKNSEDKVKRFSSDEQMITWMEKKEVIPYEGQVRGEVGPTGTKDDKGSYGITNDDLLQNKSNIIIKINQVAASATTKHDVVNGAKDIYENFVNPAISGGVIDGAGFAIDMSRYAMIGANPSFSSITVTDKSDLSGNTTIANGDSTGTRTGHTLAIKTTDVTANDTNWTETITNKKSTVTAEEDKIDTLNESATTRTTTVGTDNLTVSGTTTEVHTGNVTITNSANVTATTNGTTTETKVGNVTENHNGTTTDNNKGNVTVNNQANFTMNTSGTTTLNTTGTTTIQSTGDGSNVIVYAKDDLCETSDDVAAFKGANTTNIGSDCTNANQTKTLNVRANSADTRVTSAYTSATTATTIIGTSSISATTADYSGNTFSSHVKGLTHSGDTLNVTESTSTTIKSPTTTISGCTKIDLVSDDLNFKSCTSAGTIDFDFCNGFNVNSNAVKFEQCSTAGTFTIKEKGTSISGETLTIRESGATDFSGNTLTTTTAGNTNINVKGNLTEVVTGTTNETHTGAVTITNSNNKTENTTGAHSIYSTGNTCINSQASANFYGSGSTNIGVACNGTTKASATTVYGTTTTISANTLNETSAENTNVNVGGNLIEKVTGNTSITSTGTTTLSSTESTTIEATGANSDVCISATDSARVYGKGSTYVGVKCDGTIGSATTVEGATLGLSGNTTNISGATTLNLSGGSITEISTGKTCITAGSDLNLGGDTNTRLGYNCDGTGIANNTYVYASTAVTINSPTTNITGNTYLSGNTYFHKTCTGLTNNEIDAAFCEVLSRGAITIEKNTSPTDPQLATVYTIKQNGAVINTIEVAKDQFLQNAEVVKNTAGEWVIRLTWWIYDPDSGTHTTATTDIAASELVKDLTAVNPSDNGTALNHNVKVSAWYDSTSGDMQFSAETTPNMHVGNMYVTGTTSASTVSGTNVNGGTISGTTGKFVTLNAGTTTISGVTTINNALTVTGNTTLAATSASSISATSVTSPSVSGTSTSAGTLTVTGNATLKAITATSISASTEVKSPSISGTAVSAATFYGAMSKKLTWTGGTFTADTTNGYNGSADRVIAVPTAISHLAARGKLTIEHNGLSDIYDPASDKSLTLPHSALSIDYGANVTGRTDDSYDTSAAKTVYIPTSVKNLSNWNGSCYEFDAPLCVTGTITASGAIYSSDRNLKENIMNVSREEINKANNVLAKSFNFKSDESKSKVYGVIAQEVQEAGLDELVHTDDNGNLGVDYTSLLLLKIAYLEDLCGQMYGRITKLEDKLKKE